MSENEFSLWGQTPSSCVIVQWDMTGNRSHKLCLMSSWQARNRDETQLKTSNKTKSKEANSQSQDEFYELDCFYRRWKCRFNLGIQHHCFPQHYIYIEVLSVSIHFFFTSFYGDEKKFWSSGLSAIRVLFCTCCTLLAYLLWYKNPMDPPNRPWQLKFNELSVLW